MSSVAPGGDGGNPLLDAALAAHRVGLCPLPAANDGSKAPHPDGSQWGKYQQERPQEFVIRQWFSLSSLRYSGFGLVCGAVSGGLELFEFEGRAITDGTWDEFKKLAQVAGLWPLIDHIANGYSERTPSGGLHLLYRCPDGVTGSTPLAKDEAGEVLIETKGEGGFVIVAPSNGKTHPTGGSWVLRKGGFASIATITAEERDALLDLARSFDRRPHQEWRPSPSNSAVWGRPGDDFNVQGDPTPYLTEAGWRYLFTAKDGNQHWQRPGKSRGNSATWHPVLRLFYVFTSSTAFPESFKAYKPFAVVAFVKYGGDFGATARRLREQGFGADDREAFLAEYLSSLSSEVPNNDWPHLDPKALHGLVGDFAREAEPYTEADIVGVLVATLVMAGTAIGRGPHMIAGNGRHGTSLFAVLVGRTAQGRKGTAEDVASGVMNHTLDFPRTLGGFGSGEKIIDDLQPPAEGVHDPRLFVLESEYARVMAVNGREASILSPILRQLWDGKPVHARSRAKTAVAKVHHVGLLGETTMEELGVALSTNDAYNGFSNRHLWPVVQRTRELPKGGNVPEEVLQRHGEPLSRRILWARDQDATWVRAGSEAEDYWADVYHELCEDDPGGRLGSAINRSAPQVLRLSLLYAVLDGETAVHQVHIEAAHALWRYCRASAGIIFGNVLDPLAEKIMVALRAKGEALTGADLYAYVGGHIRAEQMRTTLAYLETKGLITTRVEKTAGRPRIVVGLANKASKAP